jgi:hypothetical protein
MVRLQSYSVVPATAEHAAQLTRNTRDADVAECWAALHQTPGEALAYSYKVSRDTRAGIANGAVVCIFGVAQETVLSTIGRPWLLATNQLKQHARVFLRLNRGVVDGWLAEYGWLENYVDARNLKAVQWLRWLGFKIESAAPYGVDQLPFHKFTMGNLNG